MADIQELSIQITVEGTDKGTKDINSLSNALKKLEKVSDSISSKFKDIDFGNLSKLTGVCEKIEKINSDNIKNLATSLKEIGKSSNNLSKLEKSITSISEKLANMNYSGFTYLAKALKDIANIDPTNIKIYTDALKDLLKITKILENYNAFNGAKTSNNSNLLLPSTESNTSSLPNSELQPTERPSDLIIGTRNEMQTFGAYLKGKFVGQINSAKKSFDKLVQSFGRIAFYRAIRTILKEITASFKEGINNAYQWSKTIGGEFSQKMDSLATYTSYLKNSLGALSIPILNSLIPIINLAINKFVNLLNIVNQVFSALNGSSTWTKAIMKETQFATATDKASKSVKNLIGGFDEINNIGGSSGGTSSGGSNSAFDFVEEKVSLNNSKVLEPLKKIIETINSVFGDWSLNAENIIKKVMVGLSAIVGYIQSGPLGSLLGVGLSLTLVNALFNNDGKINGNEFGNSLATALTTAIGGIIGFKFGGTKGALIGAEITLGLVAVLSNLKIETSAPNRMKLKKECEYLGISLKEAAQMGLNGSKKDDQIIHDRYGEYAVQMIKGLQDGAQPEVDKSKPWWKRLWNGLLNIFKDEAEINSPSKLYARYGKYLVEGLNTGISNSESSFALKINNLFGIAKQKTITGISSIWEGLKQKWQEIKNWWGRLELGSFKIKTPHFSVTEGAGLFGLPKISVDWYDKGTNYVSQDQLAMIHKGEAIIPAKYNQNPAYQPMNGNVEQILENILIAINNIDTDVYLDGNEIGKASVKYINKQSRLKGASIV